jgi:hypothetical protein
MPETFNVLEEAYLREYSAVIAGGFLLVSCLTFSEALYRGG